MNIQEKQAWFTLGVVALGIFVFFALRFFGGRLGLPESAAFFAVMATCIPLGGIELIGKKERLAGKATIDERDMAIANLATNIVYSLCLLLVLPATLLPFLFHGAVMISVSTTALLQFGMALVVIHCGVRALVVVLLYRRDRNAGEA